MKIPELPADEQSRLAALREANILDTPPEDRFDRLTRMARKIFDVPIVLISIVDENRQWFKSKIGLDVCETAREISFCGHAILSDDVLVIPNALEDTRFSDNPLVVGEPYIRFYAGCPIRVGLHKIGTFCLIDRVPREFAPEQRQRLAEMAEMAEYELGLIQIATSDLLTGIANRRGFETTAEKTLRDCRRTNASALLIGFEINHFKQINDNFGFEQGDRVLTKFTESLKATFPENEAIARIGGDEFVVLLVDAAPHTVSARVAAVASWLGRDQQAGQRAYRIEFTDVQVAFNPETHATVDSMLDDIDDAMWDIKKAMQ